MRHGYSNHSLLSLICVKQIRAAHLSGDCHYKRELLRGYMKIRGHEQVSISSSLKQLYKEYKTLEWIFCYII